MAYIKGRDGGPPAPLEQSLSCFACTLCLLLVACLCFLALFAFAAFGLRLLLPYYLSFGGGFLSFFPPSPPGYLFWSLSPPSWHWGEWWFAHFEECIVASITAQELEEDLASVSASIGDLVEGGEEEVMVEKT